MNPLRFRSLRRERKTKFPLRHPAILMAAVALGVFAFARAARAGESIQQLMASQQSCKTANFSDAAVVYSDERHKLKSIYDPELNCEKNAGNETGSRNAEAVGLSPEVAKLNPSFAREPHSAEYLPNLGACRLAYVGIRDVFESFSKLHESYCNDTMLKLQDARECGDATVKKCEPEWTAWRSVQKDYVRELNSRSVLAIRYFTALRNAARAAKDHYQGDLDKLKLALGKRGPKSGAPDFAGVDSLPDDPNVKAANGNLATQQSNALQDYYSLLRADQLPSARTISAAAAPHSLITEEALAVKTLKDYEDAFTKLQIGDYRETANMWDHWVTSQLEKNDKNSSAGDGPVKNVSKYAPDITSGAGAAQKLFNNDSPASALSGASHAPLAEAAAVAGLGALAAKSFGSSSGSGASKEAAATPSDSGKGEKAATADIGDQATDPHAAVPGAKAAATAAGTAAAGTKADPAAMESSANGFFGGNLGGEGSSRMLPGKHGAAAVAATATAEGGGTPATLADLGSSFSPNLQPKPSPRAPAQSAGSEVANLLGQMKNLFNFDDPLQGGGPPGGGGAPMQGAGPADAGPGAAPAMLADAAPGAGADVSPEVAAEAVVTPAAGSFQLDQAHGSLFGRMDTSLFQRVRARHHRCMERGQVLYGLKERIE